MSPGLVSYNNQLPDDHCPFFLKSSGRGQERAGAGPASAAASLPSPQQPGEALPPSSSC